MTHRNNISQIISGIFLILGLHIVAIINLSLLVFLFALAPNMLGGARIGSLLVYAVFRIGISQLLYVVTLVISLKQRQEWGVMKGVIIGAVLTALLNVGC